MFTHNNPYQRVDMEDEPQQSTTRRRIPRKKPQPPGIPEKQALPLLPAEKPMVERKDPPPPAFDYNSIYRSLPQQRRPSLLNDFHKKRKSEQEEYSRHQKRLKPRAPLDGQPPPYQRPSYGLKKTIVDQQMEIERLQETVHQQERTIEEKDKEVTQLKQKLATIKPKPPSTLQPLPPSRVTVPPLSTPEATVPALPSPPVKRIRETVSEKVSRFMQSQSQASSANASPILPSPTGRAGGVTATPAEVKDTDYSQGVLLRRINQYLQLVHKDKISEEGYCHGIVLLWLTMMSWGVERLFYDMIKVIAECPVDQLSTVGNTITLFLDMIEVGQNPDKFSNNTCTQQNVDEIIGEVNKLFRATATYSKEGLEAELKKLSQEENMLAVTGWWEAKVTEKKGAVTTTTTKEKGHTVGVFVRGSRYHFFDPNFKTLGDLEYPSEPLLVTEIWKKVFEAFGHKMDKGGKMSLHALHRKDPPKAEPLPAAPPKPPASLPKPPASLPMQFSASPKPPVSLPKPPEAAQPKPFTPFVPTPPLSAPQQTSYRSRLFREHMQRTPVSQPPMPPPGGFAALPRVLQLKQQQEPPVPQQSRPMVFA